MYQASADDDTRTTSTKNRTVYKFWSLDDTDGLLDEEQII